MKLEKYKPENLRRSQKGINVHPIQRGGILTPEAKRILSEWADGYSACDLCFEGRIDLIQKPPVADLKDDIAEFLGMDDVRFTAGARHGKFVVMSAFEGTVVLDSLAHYTSYIAAELSGLRVYEVPNSGYPEFRVEAEGYAQVFENVKKETGSYPSLALLTHVDYRYGNLSDAREIGRICRDFGVPFILNTAYTSGIMEVDGKSLNADFIIGSGHKSWAATAPIGILAINFDYSSEVLKTSEQRGNWSGRAFTKKEPALFGCSPVYGLPVITLMASFPGVVERVKRWEDEVKKARWFVREMEKIEGVRALGERPRNHTLVQFESPSFHLIAMNHRRKGYFLYSELKKRGIFGIHPGMTKNFKLNTYGLSWEEVETVAGAFKEIAEKYGVGVED